MTEPRPTLSVLMIVKDEERLIGEVLESVKWADEIVVVDSGSRDRTEEIVRSYTDRFYVLPYEGEGRMRQHTLDRATGQWMLYLDGDEVVTPALRQSIQAAIADPGPYAGFRVQLHTWFLGQWFGTRGWRREWKTRLFRKDCGTFPDRTVHVGAAVDGPVGSLDGVLLHYPYRDLAHAREKMDRYASAGAEILLSRGVRSSKPEAYARGGLRFLRDYLLGGDFLYGRAGLVRAGLMAHYTRAKYATVGAAAPRRVDKPLG